MKSCAEQAIANRWILSSSASWLFEVLQTARVDLHRPKMLIIQFHTLSLWKHASHTSFIHFCKMSLIELQRYFIVVLVSKLVSHHKKRGKNGMKENANHTISIYGNCMINIFFKNFFLWKKKLWTINSTAGKTFKRFLGCYDWKLWLFFNFCFLKKKHSSYNFHIWKLFD